MCVFVNRQNCNDKAQRVFVSRKNDKSQRAAAILNSCQITGAACCVAVDKVLATVPLTDYEDWKAKTAQATDLVQVLLPLPSTGGELASIGGALTSTGGALTLTLQ
jgi:hypothetical protein